MPTSNTTRHTIWYDTAGTQGSPVLLIMGLTMRGEAWRFQIQEFAREHRVAWFDHAGVGQSGATVVRDLSMRHMALDALGVMDSAGWDQAHIVGISMGGMIAQHLALRAPNRVLSLTLAATHPGGPDFRIPPVRGLRHFAASYTGGREHRLAALGRLLFAQEFRESNPAHVRDIVRADFVRPPPVAVSVGQIGAIMRHDTRARLSELGRQHTLIVRPGQDVLVNARGSDLLADGIPDADLVRFDESGHAVPRQCADRFNEVVLSHIRSADR